LAVPSSLSLKQPSYAFHTTSAEAPDSATGSAIVAALTLARAKASRMAVATGSAAPSPPISAIMDGPAPLMYEPIAPPPHAAVMALTIPGTNPERYGWIGARDGQCHEGGV